MNGAGGHKRNTTGDTVKFQYYDNYNSNTSDYSETARINRNTDEKKFMEEFYPVDKELMSTYIARTQTAENKLIEHSMYKHIYGGRKPWPSHSSTRYCLVCTLCQFVNIHRDIWISLSQIIDVSKLQLNVTNDVNEPFATVTVTQL